MALLTEQNILRSLPDPGKSGKSTFWVAYSGGLDSQVLLHLLQGIVPLSQLKALHINHGLNPRADDWESHCRDYCRQQGIAFESRKISVQMHAASLELQARQARYQVFEAVLGAEDYLLMAHHQDDQAETVLYRLLRGSGPRGLAGMPARRRLGKGALLRPLLPFSRQELQDYAVTRQLQWIEDASNLDVSFDRNFLRREVLPLLRTRWPEAAKSLQRSAELCEDAETLLKVLAEGDLDKVQVATRGVEFKLNLDLLRGLSAVRQRNALRIWFHRLSAEHGVPAPGYEELRRIVEEVIVAGDDAEPLVSWKSMDIEIQVRRYRNELYVMPDFPAQPADAVLPFSISQTLELGGGLGTVSLQEVEHKGFYCAEQDRLEIRFRADDKKARPQGRKTRSFKKLFQDYAVPPWWRERLPLLYVNDRLAAVGDLFVCAQEAPEAEKKQYVLVWQKPDIHCRQ